MSGFSVKSVRMRLVLVVALAVLMMLYPTGEYAPPQNSQPESVSTSHPALMFPQSTSFSLEHALQAWLDSVFRPARNFFQESLGYVRPAWATGSNFGITTPGSTSYPYQTPVRVQGNARGTSISGSTISLTFASTPANGNIIIIAVYSEYGQMAINTVNSISQTGVTWSGGGNGLQVRQSGAVYLSDTEIWIGTVGASAGKTITVTLSGPVFGAIADACEYSGLAPASSVLDKTATSTDANIANPVTGTTATTTAANELFIGAIGVAENYSTATQSSPTNGFTLYDGANLQGTYLFWSSLGFLEKIVTATGTASTGVTIPTADWENTGVIATFKARNLQTGFTKGTKVQYAGATTPANAVSSFSFYITNYVSGDKVVLALYDDSGGNPNHRLWYSSASGTDLGGTGWKSINESSGTVDPAWSWNVGLTQSAYYWFMWQWNSADAGPSYALGGSGTGIYLAQPFGTLLSTWSGGTLSTQNWSMYLTYSAPSTQPLKVAMSNSAPSATVTVNGCSPSPSTFSSDGAVHNILMDSSCSFTLSFSNSGNTRNGFSVGGSFSATSASQTSCTSGTCGEIDLTAYDQLQNTYQASANAQTNFDTGMTWVISGTVLGAVSSTVCTITSTAAPTDSCTGWTDYNLAASFPSASSSPPSNSRWQSSGTLSFTDTTGGNTRNVNYYKQWTNTFRITAKAQTIFDGSMSLAITGTYFGASSATICSISTPGDMPSSSCTGYSDNGVAATFAAALSGAPTNSRWENAAGGTSSTAIITSGANTYNVNYYKQWKQALSYSVLGGGSPTAPTLTATQYGSAYTPSLTGTETNYWADANQAWSVTNPLGGSTGSEQWYTSQSTSGTVTSSQTTAFSYQHQYMLTMTAGMGGSVTPTTGWQNNGATPTITATPDGSHNFVLWTGSGTGCYSGPTNPSIVTMSAAIIESASFNAAGTMTVSYSVTGGGSGYAAPWFNYVSGGVAQHYQMTMTGVGKSVDSGSAWTVSQTSGNTASQLLLGSSGTEQWVTGQSVSGTASTQSISFLFYHQYLQTLSYSVTGGGLGYAAPTYTADRNGVSTPQVLTGSAAGYWYDSLSLWSVTNPLGGSGGSEQWFTSQTVGGTISSATTAVFNYQNQFYLTMLVSPPSSGAPSPVSSWRDAGASVQISADPSGGFAFKNWTCTGTGCYSGTSNSATIPSMVGPMTEMAHFSAQYQITFTSIGIGGDTSGTVVTINGNAKTQSQLPFTAQYVSGFSISYAYASPTAATADKQYVWTSTSGLGQTLLSATFTVSAAGTITATYTPQYHIAVVSPYGSPTASGWVDVDGSYPTSITSPDGDYACSGYKIDAGNL